MKTNQIESATTQITEEIWSLLNRIGVSRPKTLSLKTKRRIEDLNRLANSTPFKHEAATARRIAQQLLEGVK